MTLKLVKGLSYCGHGIRASAKIPAVTVDDETAAALLATGYFAPCGCDSAGDEPDEEADSEPDYAELAGMTKAELVQFADATGVDLTGCRTKADILTAISEANGGCCTMIEIQHR
ncbi:MAG: hypothetical protein LUD72_02015 [Bacteroidales bacterium]|nr:hypothetical protein [Bacteroidales bacterium]